MRLRVFFVVLVLITAGVLADGFAAAANDRAASISRLWDENNRRAAQREVKKWMEAEPKSPQPWLLAARFRFEEKRFKKCIAMAEAALKKAPHNAEAYYWKGRAYEAMGSPLEAANEYRAALMIENDDREAREGLNRVLALLGSSADGSGAGFGTN